MAILDITMGSENVESASAKVHAFVSVNGEELHISKAQCRQIGIARLGTTNTYDAVPGMRHDVCGSWTRANYDIPNGTLVKIFASCNKGFGDLPRLHSVVVQVHERHDLIRLEVELTGNSRCAYPTLSIRGRMRLVGLEEAQTLGFRCNPAFAVQFNQTEPLIRVAEVLERGSRPTRRVMGSEMPTQRGMIAPPPAPSTHQLDPVVVEAGLASARALRELDAATLRGFGLSRTVAGRTQGVVPNPTTAEMWQTAIAAAGGIARPGGSIVSLDSLTMMPTEPAPAPLPPSLPGIARKRRLL